MLNFILRIEKNILCYLLRNVDKRVLKINKKLYSKNYKKEVKERTDKLLNSEDCVKKIAKKYVENLSGPRKEMVYYHFLLYNILNVYESRFCNISEDIKFNQVCNEHIKALNYFIKATINNNDEQMKEAAGHLRRGLLDVIKQYCDEAKGEIQKKQCLINKKDGEDYNNYIKDYMKKQNDAEDFLIKARDEEPSIGNNIEKNMNILDIFVEAFVMHDEWYKFQSENFTNFIKPKISIIKNLLTWVATIILVYKLILDYSYIQRLFWQIIDRFR